jgi:hypothetical protein
VLLVCPASTVGASLAGIGIADLEEGVLPVQAAQVSQRCCHARTSMRTMKIRRNTLVATARGITLAASAVEVADDGPEATRRPPKEIGKITGEGVETLRRRFARLRSGTWRRLGTAVSRARASGFDHVLTRLIVSSSTSTSESLVVDEPMTLCCNSRPLCSVVGVGGGARGGGLDTSTSSCLEIYESEFIASLWSALVNTGHRQADETV